MKLFYGVIVDLCLVFGLIGCFVNKFPGPLLVLIATLVAKFGLDIDTLSWTTVIIIGVLWIFSAILNKKILPILVKKIHDFSSLGSWGCTIGVLLGFSLFAIPDLSEGATIGLLIVDFVVLPFLFAFLFELIKQKKLSTAAKVAGSAYCVYFVGTLVKLVAFYIAVRALFGLGNFDM